ncbi:MAG: S8 family serine peptidase [Rhizobium sp.]
MRSSSFLTRALCALPLAIAAAIPNVAHTQDGSAAVELRGVDGMTSALQVKLAETGVPKFLKIEDPQTTLEGAISASCGDQPVHVQQALTAEALALNGLKQPDAVIDKGVTVAIPFCLPIERSVEVVVEQGDTIETLLRKNTGVYGKRTLRKTFDLNRDRTTARTPEAFFRNLTVGQKIRLPYGADPRVFIPRTVGTDLNQIVHDLSAPQIAEAIVTTAAASPQIATSGENAFNLVESVEIASVDGGTPCGPTEDIGRPIDMAALKAVFDEEARLLAEFGEQVQTANIGVVDTGLANPEDDFFSEDVLLVNRYESEGVDGQDDDNPENGAIDDYYGINLNFVPKTGDVQPYDADKLSWQYHGTRMASLVLGGPDITASWGGKRPPLKLRVVNFASAQTKGGMVSPERLATAVEQLDQDKVDIVNISLSSNSDHSGTRQALREKSRMLFVVAAGNKQGGPGADLLTTTLFPASYGGPNGKNILTVAAYGRSGKKAPFSHFSNLYVDLLAPGCGIETRDGDGSVVSDTGSSPSTALVSFTAGLLRSLGISNPNGIKTRILASVDQDERLTSFAWSRGRLNPIKALSLRRDVVQTADNALHFGKIADRDALLALCANGAADFSRPRDIYKVVPNIQTPSGTMIDYWTYSNGVLAAQRCEQRTTDIGTISLDGGEIPLQDVRDVVYRWR